MLQFADLDLDRIPERVLAGETLSREEAAASSTAPTCG